MPRSDRLFLLLQALRRLPSPVTAARLAEETGVSVRSVYRDIASLRASGADIGGDRGYGYCLIEDGSLPPQIFDRIEIEALSLGLAEVRQMGDPALAAAAASVLAKVSATLPSHAQQHLLHAISCVHRFEPRFSAPDHMPVVREACWREDALSIAYVDRGGQASERAIWPLAIVYLEATLMLLAWCCLRQDFRMFRLDRIEAVTPAGESFRPRRAALLREYLARLRAEGRRQAA